MQRGPRLRCRCCGQTFSDANVFSEAGWIETLISGLCEVCFDALADLISMDTDDGTDEQDEQGADSGTGRRA
jgi:hypothetical protein